MTAEVVAEVKAPEGTQTVEVAVAAEVEEPLKVVAQEEKVVAVEGDVKEPNDEEESKPKTVEKSSPYKEESNFLSDLKEFERKALSEFKTKLEEAILGNKLFEKEEPKKKETEKEEKKEEGANAAESDEKKPEKEEKKEEGANAAESDEKKPEKEEEEKEVANAAESDEKKPEKEEEKKEVANAAESDEKKPEKEEEKKEEGANAVESDEKKPEKEEEEKKVEEVEVDKDVSLWGVPLLPSKGAEGTDVVLLKFLRARDFKVNDAFEMLKKTLKWRKESNIDSIVDEDFGSDLASTAYILGFDLEGHPVCYNIFGVFENEELYQKTFGTEESRIEYLRWRCQLMEKGIQKLNFKPGGVSSLLQINDLKNSPGPYKVLNAANQAVAVLQDNYPEMVAKNIIINAPFWYYAINALSSPFLTQRAKSKFVVSHPSKVIETLLKYIPIEEIPIQYGGFKRENDFEFSAEDGAVSELTLKAGSTATVEIPALEVGNTLCWDLTVLGWEVSYKEEFVPTDEGSYTIIVQKEKKIGSQEEPIRNTFRNNEAGKVIITLENTSNKKKRVLYRYKTNNKSSF
ncbi:hypothetical protein Lal_00043860 [Lupinus albus]|uniref:Putative cellular retinaldehyde binding/alpha-tocopherol transport, GOLD domain, CRAL/TRIO n=1 Tax=Lupinus albus TaxID=3870 RepID=A0A6A4PCT5_LUPAL|nr:putative cellular retinaldehyde binding/alpha-tocopherol transport, GOLD domain, CRAL/TRIO [Lupinus albus]KAF1895215.1 hypothetical protein Lal_00043860 [Lupinus albus]